MSSVIAGSNTTSAFQLSEHDLNPLATLVVGVGSLILDDVILAEGGCRSSLRSGPGGTFSGFFILRNGYACNVDGLAFGNEFNDFFDNHLAAPLSTTRVRIDNGVAL